MPDVRIVNIERSIDVTRDQTILSAALEAGIDYPHGCRSGRCGSCKSRLVEGEVRLLDHTRFALSEAEREAGLILACRAVPGSDAVVAWLGDEEDRADHPLRCVEARVSAIEEATHDIRVLRLRPDGPPLAFSAGQYATLTVPGAPPRDYSMANPPGAAEIELHVRRVPGGATSEAIHGRLRPGDRVRLKGPRGAAHLRTGHTGPILAVAGGSGLAPIRSIVETALALRLRQPIHVYFGARSERDLYLTDRFQALADRHANLRFEAVLSEPTEATGTRAGLVVDAALADLPDLDGWTCYAAGPPAMVEALAEGAPLNGLRREDLHADVFFTPEPPLGANERKRA